MAALHSGLGKAFACKNIDIFYWIKFRKLKYSNTLYHIFCSSLTRNEKIKISSLYKVNRQPSLDLLFILRLFDFLTHEALCKDVEVSGEMPRLHPAVIIPLGWTQMGLFSCHQQGKSKVEHLQIQKCTWTHTCSVSYFHIQDNTDIRNKKGAQMWRDVHGILD